MGERVPVSRADKERMSGNTDEDQEGVEVIKMHCELISVHENHNHTIKMKKKKKIYKQFL